jgi:hypothetical protein
MLCTACDLTFLILKKLLNMPLAIGNLWNETKAKMNYCS